MVGSNQYMKRDLGVIISKGLKFPKKFLLTKNKANLMLGIINRVSCKSAEIISKLYRSYVRPHLEYLSSCPEYLSPIHVNEADMLEGLKKRTTKMIPSLRYEEILWYD